MMSLKEKVAQIRKDLKEVGITAKMASVRGKNSLYDESITVKIKDITVNKKLIDEIVYKYDEYNGEILAGGNTFTHVEFDYDVLLEARKDFIRLATKIYTEGKEACKKDYELHRAIEEDSKVVLYQPNYSNGNPPSIALNNMVKVVDEYGEFNSYDRVKSYIANTPEDIATFLVECKYQYGLNI